MTTPLPGLSAPKNVVLLRYAPLSENPASQSSADASLAGLVQVKNAHQKPCEELSPGTTPRSDKQQPRLGSALGRLYNLLSGHGLASAERQTARREWAATEMTRAGNLPVVDEPTFETTMATWNASAPTQPNMAVGGDEEVMKAIKAAEDAHAKKLAAIAAQGNP